jgi:HEPN domain-containing protein
VTNYQKTVNYFLESSNEDWKIAQKLFQTKDFGYSLFFCHLTLEKLLKALVVTHTNNPPAHTHFLLRLAEQAELPLTKSQVKNLKDITKFNIAGRYDDEKQEFKKLATHTYTLKYLKITEELLIWLRKHYQKK